MLVWLLVPETKGRPFAELDELSARRIPAWRFAKTETAAHRGIAREDKGGDKD